MKRGIILCLMLIAVSGLFAQNQSTVAISDPGTDLGHVNDTDIDGDGDPDDEYTDLVTVGGGALYGGGNANSTVMPYFVQPDANLNPGYAPTYDNTQLFSHWTWEFGVAPTGVNILPADFTADLPGITTDTLNQVFLEFLNTSEGETFNLQVSESVPVIGCTSNTRYVQVQVVGVPTAVKETSITNEKYCSDLGPSSNPKFTLTGYPPFSLTIDRDVDAINTDTTIDELAASDATTTRDYAVGTVAGQYSLTNTSGNEYTLELLGEPLTSDGRITTITYTLQGVNDKISRKSDRLVSHLYYFTDASFSYTAYPTPTTGNIRSVANN